MAPSTHVTTNNTVAPKTNIKVKINVQIVDA